MAKKQSKSKKTEQKPLVEGKRLRFAIARVALSAVLALVLLFMSGISLLTLMFGAKSVDLMEDMTKGAIQELTGEVLSSYRANDGGTYSAVKCEDGIITVKTERKPEAGKELSVTGFVRVLDEEERADLFAWYDANGDFAGGEGYFDNLSPMFIHDNYGRMFPIVTSKILTALAMLSAVYIIVVYMGVSKGKYDD